MRSFDNRQSKDIKLFKAPGSNGLHVGLFQRFWRLVEDSVRKEIDNIFVSCKILEYLNWTLITLIPKCNNHIHLCNYRLISLCNLFYKIVTKLIVVRTCSFMTDLVSPLRTSFIPGRKGVDNTIIVYELIHSISKMKLKLRLMAIKTWMELY